MLTSYLPEILKQSTVLALTAREPLNYFLLLRSLFRSIGGGAQDVLYGKFLQLLPNLLQFLNKLTSCQHRIQMRELFVELCLTVPVRLSSLLPYLPLLMDPLVCAMNGSPNIVTQGLRTLELCVDNLQPDFLLEHMIPVRAALVQGLYRVVSKAPDTASMAAAFRILGKFGGANRRLLYQPQILDVVSQADRFQSYINMEFSRMGLDGQHSIQLPLTELMRVAADQMRYPADQILNPNPQMIPSASMKKWCMELSKAILLAGFGSSGSHFVPNRNLPRVLKKLLTEFDVNNRTTEVYTCTRENDRELFVNALLVMIYGIWNKDGFRNAYSKFFIKVLRQFSIIAVLEYVGGNNWIRQAEEDGVIVLCLDSSVLVDALIICLSETSTTFLFAGVMCLRHINESLCLALPHTDQMSKVPMCKYLMEKVFKLCHGPAWYARAGGIQAIVYMIESFPRKFVMDYVIDIVDSVVEVLLGLTEEISSGATDAAYECLKKMMLVYFIPEEGQEEENLTLATIFMSVFAKHYFSSNERIRELMADLVGVCMKYSRLAPTLDKFYFRFKEFFEPEMERILSTLPTMSLSDASGSLDGVQNYMLTCPDGFEFEKDADLYKRYLTHLLDIAQTDTTVISQRYAYKKCETCPSHFLPPHPIPVQIDLMRASALQCLVIAYDRLKKQMSSEDDIEGEEVMSEILALDSPSITVEQVYESKETWRRLMTVLLRAAVDKENPDIAEKIQPVLLKVSPIPTNIIATFGAAYIRSISRASENNEEISFHDIRKFSVLVDLNPGILVRKMAINLANQMRDDRIRNCRVRSGEEKAIRELDRIGFTVKMLAGCQMSTLTHEMVIDIARFAAHFDYTYAQDVLVNWIDDVSTLMNKCPVEVWKFFLDRESILDPGRRSFIRRIIVYPSSGPLRQTFMDNPEYLDRLIDMDGTVFRDDDDRVISDREMFALSLVDRISRNCHDWLISPLSPIAKLKKLFNSTGFVERYGVRTITEVNAQEIQVLSMTEHKYKVPKLIINIFLRYLRVNIFDYDMFFDVVSVFMGKFVTDFCFVREYLEVEVIPKMPLKWRREIFLKVMEMLEENPVIGQGLQYVKVVQYLIIPSLQWAFERYDTDEIVGSTPIDDSEISIEVDSSANMDNLVGRLTAVIARKLSLSDGMVIVLYQLCTLFVQHASEHIHNNNCKKQGGRLRVFMLFAWPCLTEPNRQDPTMRYTGFYFLANIIERFTINRKIVLQVFHQLVTTYQQDTRDQVRRAIDILTPALRVRMEDGHQQILTSVKKILIEECHNLSHIQHIFHMIIRNYRVYYHVRNELLSHLLNAVQRALVMPNSVMENWQTRRYAIEICEMVVKWELFKNLKTDHAISDEEALEIDNRLDKLRSAASTERFDFEDGPNKRDLPESQRVVGKEPVDIIVNMLLRFCMTFHQNSNSSTGSQSQSQDLIKKSQLLLRAALRSSVWGEFVSIRTSMIEKYLSISNDANIRNDTMSPVFVSVIANAQQTLDMVCAIIPVIPKQTLMNMMRPLQRPLIQCLNSGPQLPEQNFKMTRLVTQIITRLLEKTTVTMHGLDELDMLNNHIIKFLNDNFSALVKTPGAPVLGVLGAFSLLRSICAHEPAYLDNVLSSFVKVVERAAKEHLSYTSNGSEGSIVKNVAELLVVCMELIRVRADQICVEIKRIMVSSVIAEIILKSHNDKVIQACVKVLGSFITPHDMDFTVNVVLINLVRIQTMIVSKFKSSKDLIADFLVVVIKVFENSEYRNSDPGSRLWEGFFWGLKSADPQTRENFSIIWEMTWPQLATVDMVHRMKYIIRDQDWSKFKHAFWLKFALWGMLRTIAKRPCDSTNKRKKVMFLNCATPWRTIEYAAKLRHDPTIMEQEMKQEEPEPMDTDEKPSQDDQNEKVPESLDALLEGQQELLDEASNYDFADALDVISQITFGLSDSDNKVTSNIWVILFRSFWSSLSPSEIEDFNTLIIPFLSSGVHNNYQTGVQDSVLAVWLRALADLTEIPARLIEFISIKHECWHTGIKILENNVICRPIAKQLKNIYLQELTVDPSLVSDMQTLESLGALYQDILEFDQFAGIWERRAVFPETVRAMSAIQLGDMESAATLLEQAMSKTHDALAPAVGTSNSSSMEKHVSPFIDKEYDHWMDMYISSCSELLQWQTVAEVCNSKDMQHVQGLITAASHIPDWAVVEECKNQIAGCIPPNFHLDYTIYNLMSTVMRLNENSHPNHSKEKCKIALQECIEAHISRWRALPSVASYAHVKLLQSMNLIQDIEESIEVRIALCDQPNKIDQALMMDMKGLMKVYRSRSPASADNMSFISSWYDWRNQIYGMMLQRFEQWDKLGLNLSTNGNQSIVPIHSMAQAQLTAAKHAQHLGFHNLTKDLLNKLAGLTAIPMVDARNKVCTYGKTLREMAKNTPEEKLKQELLHEALEVLEDVRIDDFQKDQIAMLLYNRANIHSVLGQTQNADNTFSTAAQLVELHNGNSVVACKLMKNWGHHLYNQFFSSKVCKETADNYGRQALACYFVAARVDNDVKARKAIARILWLAKHLAACGSHDALNRGIKNQIHALNLFNWLYWLPQLVTEIRHKPSSNFVLIMCRMAAAHPLQVFYHIREAVSNEYIDTIFEKDYSEEEMSAEEFDEDLFPKDEPFSRILKICLKYRPTDVRVFHRVLKELDEMDETWVERQLRYALRLKEQMFNDISDQMDANFNHIQFSEFVKNIAAAWKKQLEEDYEYFQQNFNTDYLVLRNRKKINVTQGFMGGKKSQIMFEKQLSHVFTDPPEMKDEFSFVTEFTQMIVPRLDLDNVEENGPTILVRTVVDWIRILRRRLEKLPKRVPLECSSLYLSRFSHRTGCIEMPNDLLNVLKNKNPQNSTNLTGQYISMISRFEPTFEIITRGEHVMRKLYIRGQLGKSAAFYLKKSIDDEPPNRVPQLLKHLDHLLQFDHESARRHLHVPNIVQLRVGPKTILYEIASVQPYAMPTDCTRNYPSSQIEIIHPYDVLAASLNGNVLPADMVTHFFDRFAQSAPSIGKPNGDGGMLTQPRLLEPHNVKHIIFEDFARDMVSYRFLFEYFQSRYPDPVMYYSMRKQFLHSLAVLSTIEYHCNLTPLGPDQMMMFANTGVLCNPWYRFEISKGQSLEEIEHFGHEVPFRLTPNIAFIVGVAQDGDFMWKVVMKTLLWDEYANNVDSENMVYVCHASNSYVAGITNKLKNTNDPDAKVKKDDIASLISRAKDSDNQSRMPPTYFAWY
uniref:Non-specific serine/threonine protein kinase n=1 Tax=Caenorhabditis tropicalis TaxID=1561998 RepID=A0A1I7TFD1_9PELO